MEPIKFIPPEPQVLNEASPASKRDVETYEKSIKLNSNLNEEVRGVKVRCWLEFFIRGSFFIFLCYVSHISGMNFGTFFLGGFWAVTCFAWGGKLNYN